MRLCPLALTVALAACPGSTPPRPDASRDAPSEGVTWPDGPRSDRADALSPDGPGSDGARPDGPRPPDAPKLADLKPPADLLPTGAVMAYGKCAAGDPRAKLLAEVAPPGTVATNAKLGVSVTFANCSGKTWKATPANAPTGHKLGSQAPQDNSTWGQGRVALPGDVAANQQVRIGFIATAPGTPGAYGYQWAILEEGIEWYLEGPSPLHTVTVQAPQQTVALCAGVTADASGATSATAPIQQCVNQTPSGGTLELPVGVFRMTGAVVLSKPITLRTAGTASSTTGCLRSGAPPCAVLRADPNLDTENGFLQLAQGSSAITVRHLVLDGNRGARLGSAAAATCASGVNRKGFNATARGDGHTFSYNASVKALCGTGMEWRGDQATIVGNLFEDNGVNATKNLWSDGLTVHEASSSKITGNLFRNNSDVDLILGGGTNTTVSGNVIEHTWNLTFAGIMLDNFNGGTSGNFTGTVVSGNTVSCGAQLCDFGINLGPHAWYLSANTLGGEVTGNTVTSAKLCLNIDGAGTAAAPIKVHKNTLSGSPSSATFMCGVRATSNYNIGPGSVVDKAGDPTPHTSITWHACP